MVGGMAEPRAADSAVSKRSDESAVLFVTQLAGWRFWANIAAGVVVCAVIGSCLGLAIDRMWIGAVFGAIVALAGGFFARKKDELPVRQIERGPEPATLFVELRRGGSFTWRASDVQWIETLSEGDDDAAKTHWVVVRRPALASTRFRVRDGDQAAEVVLAMRDALGLREPPEAALPEKATPPAIEAAEAAKPATDEPTSEPTATKDPT